MTSMFSVAAKAAFAILSARRRVADDPLRIRARAPVRLASLVAVAIVGSLLVLGGVAAGDDPRGNNGTVKIHEEPGEAEPIRSNEPHVCTFHLHGFNFDAQGSGVWRIERWSPTGSGTAAGPEPWGPADGEGNWKSRVIELPDGHYKLFFEQTSPQTPGAEKHKVFWVECGPPPVIPESPLALLLPLTAAAVLGAAVLAARRRPTPLFGAAR